MATTNKTTKKKTEPKEDKKLTYTMCPSRLRTLTTPSKEA